MASLPRFAMFARIGAGNECFTFRLKPAHAHLPQTVATYARLGEKRGHAKHLRLYRICVAQVACTITCCNLYKRPFVTYGIESNEANAYDSMILSTLQTLPAGEMFRVRRFSLRLPSNLKSNRMYLCSEHRKWILPVR